MYSLSACSPSVRPLSVCDSSCHSALSVVAARGEWIINQSHSPATSQHQRKIFQLAKNIQRHRGYTADNGHSAEIADQSSSSSGDLIHHQHRRLSSTSPALVHATLDNDASKKSPPSTSKIKLVKSLLRKMAASEHNELIHYGGDKCNLSTAGQLSD